MISHPAFSVEPWCLRETELHLDVLAQSESVFALSNGHIGWRGNLDEGAPHGLPGCYLKLIRLLVDDEPFDIRYGELRSHERLLDFRAGVLHRRGPSSPHRPTARVKISSRGSGRREGCAAQLWH